jgi:hypothetical protein
VLLFSFALLCVVPCVALSALRLRCVFLFVCRIFVTSLFSAIAFLCFPSPGGVSLNECGDLFLFFFFSCHQIRGWRLPRERRFRMTKGIDIQALIKLSPAFCDRRNHTFELDNGEAF